MYLNNGEKKPWTYKLYVHCKIQCEFKLIYIKKITNIGHVLNYKNVHNYA